MLKLFFRVLWLGSFFLTAGCSGPEGNHPRFGSGTGQGSDAGSSSSGVVKADSNSLVAPKKVQPGEITGVNIDRLFALMQSQRVLLVDCRPAIFYHLGHIQDALHIPLKKYAGLINVTKGQFDNAIATGKVIVIYCQNLNCPDAYIFAKKIAADGYSISVYKGGWEEWKASGL